MNAEKYGLDKIYFGGCFIRGPSLGYLNTYIVRVAHVCTPGYAATVTTLSYAIRFWSKGTKRALFLRHEGFLFVFLVLAIVLLAYVKHQRLHRRMD